MILTASCFFRCINNSIHYYHTHTIWRFLTSKFYLSHIHPCYDCFSIKFHQGFLILAQTIKTFSVKCYSILHSLFQCALAKHKGDDEKTPYPLKCSLLQWNKDVLVSNDVYTDTTIVYACEIKIFCVSKQNF